MSRRAETQGYRIFSWFKRLWKTWRRTARREYEAERANIFSQETSDMEKEQTTKELRTAVLKAQKLEKELHTVRKLMEDEVADREY
jgi:hypothetical protein